MKSSRVLVGAAVGLVVGFHFGIVASGRIVRAQTSIIVGQSWRHPESGVVESVMNSGARCYTHGQSGISCFGN
jgi:hypothetical protein